MENFNKINTRQVYKVNWKKDPVLELLRLDFKRSGTFTYLPKDLVGFLGLRKGEDKNLLAILDSESEYNYVILILDRDLISLLKPIILARRQKAQQLQQELKKQLQVQRQQAEAKQGDIMIDTEVRT